MLCPLPQYKVRACFTTGYAGFAIRVWSSVTPGEFAVQVMCSTVRGHAVLLYECALQLLLLNMFALFSWGFTGRADSCHSLLTKAQHGAPEPDGGDVADYYRHLYCGHAGLGTADDDERG